MSTLTDQRYLRTIQYKDTSNLDARIYLHKHFSTNQGSWQRWVFDHFDFPRSGTVLDVGCGPGDLWLENADRLPAGGAVVLSDLSQGMVRRAKQQLEGRGLRFDYRVLDARAIPFPDCSFDVVVANHMLYHVPRRRRVLCEIHRVLKPGGRLYAATNGRDHLRELHELLRAACPDAELPDVAASFGLANGAGQLAVFFNEVTRYLRDDALMVTEAEPLIAYLGSMGCRSTVSRNRETLNRAICERIAEKGAFRIRKRSGLFTAHKA